MQPAQPHVLTVSQLVTFVKARLEEQGDAWVEGEVSNLREPSSGHLYFTLKDVSAQMRGVMFRFYAQKLRFRLQDGLQVVCFGRLTVYEPRGDLQLLTTFMEPKGYGALQLAFEQLKEKLRVEGLFDDGRKRPIPRLPRRVGVATSPSGAALRDILNVLGRRNERVSVVIAPCRVQGEGAAAEIAAAIEALNARDLDVIIVGRGGGSIEDLWAFNEEVVARAIAASRIPVISAVGHEIDFTIADFTADLRAATPSAAAELVSCSRLEMVERVDGLRRRLISAARSRVSDLDRRLAAASVAQLLARTVNRVSRYGQRLDDARARLRRALEKRSAACRRGVERLRFWERVRAYSGVLARGRERVEHFDARGRLALRTRIQRESIALAGLQARLEAVDPRSVLKRGYAICHRDSDKAIVRDAAEAPAGAAVSVELYRGRLSCRVVWSGRDGDAAPGAGAPPSSQEEP